MCQPLMPTVIYLHLSSSIRPSSTVFPAIFPPPFPLQAVNAASIYSCEHISYLHLEVPTFHCNGLLIYFNKTRKGAILTTAAIFSPSPTNYGFVTLIMQAASSAPQTHSLLFSWFCFSCETRLFI